MKHIIITLSLILCGLSSCMQSTKQVIREEVSSTTVYDNIETRMPGTLFVNGSYLIWTDPLSADNQVHVVDIKSKQEIGKFLNIGQGPDEFTGPVITVSNSGNQLIATDMNKPLTGYYPLDSLLTKQPFTGNFVKNDTRNVTRIVEIENGNLLTFNLMDTPSFSYKGNKFGKSLFDKPIENYWDVAQGNILYNPDKQLLIYSVIPFPYMAAYKKQGESFTLAWEQKEKADYTISNGEVKLDKSQNGAMELALTKDYIVTLQRDYTQDNTDESTVGRDTEKLPTTLFLYDYQGSLKKILNLNVPTIRIAADYRTNEVYAICVDPDFVVKKVSL